MRKCQRWNRQCAVAALQELHADENASFEAFERVDDMLRCIDYCDSVGNRRSAYELALRWAAEAAFFGQAYWGTEYTVSFILDWAEAARSGE